MRHRRLLVRCREHVGDIINSTPALQTLRRNYPEAHITIEVGQGLGELVATPMFGNRVVERRRHQGKGGKVARVLWMMRQRFSAVVVLDESRPLMMEAFLSGIPFRCGLHRGKSPWIYSVGVRHRKDVHECRGNFEALMQAMKLEVCHSLALPIRSEYAQRAREVMRSAGADLSRPLVGVHCATAPTRRHWPAAHISELASQLAKDGVQTVLVGSSADQEAAGAIRAPGVIDVTGRLGLLETAAAIELMEAFVCGDSGPMHMAAAIGTFSVCLYLSGADPTYTGPGGNCHTILQSSTGDLGGISAAQVHEIVGDRCFVK